MQCGAELIVENHLLRHYSHVGREHINSF